MAQRLGNVAVGTVVKLNESGVPVNYLVVHQGNPDPELYDASCNGTWVLRQDIMALGMWDAGNSNVLPGADIFTTMAGYLSLFDPAIQASIKTVKIPYCVGDGSSTIKSGANGLECQIFPLGGYEVGLDHTTNIYLPRDGQKLDYFELGTGTSANKKRIAKLNGTADRWFLRSSYTGNNVEAWILYSVGSENILKTNESCGIRHAFILSPSLSVTDDGTVLAYNVPILTVPDIIMQGQSVPLSWAAANGATTYILERNADSGGWVQIYSGSDLSFNDTAGSWATVQYQVKAGAGSNFGDYTTSPAIPVVSTYTLVISGTDSDLGTVTADIPYTVVTDTSNPITLTRTVNGQMVATTTVNNGFGYSIPVLDLPTGSGTIEITASVNASGGSPVTATRTWTYTKTPVTFPNTGGPAQLSQGGQNVFPPTLAEAVRVATNWGGSLDKALELLLPVVNSAVIQVGSYEGTGTFGVDNPSTLTFNQEPVVVTIYGGGQTLVISSTDTGSTAYISGNQAKWYSTVSAEEQMNTSGVTYNYVAVAKGVTA